MAPVLFAIVLSACGGDGAGDTGNEGVTAGGDTGGPGYGAGVASAAPTGAADLTIMDFAFHPSTLEVTEGQTIAVANEDSVTHTFTSDDGTVDQRVGAGQSLEVTLSGVSSGGFHCEIHPSMTGNLQVS
jgi:plastocyanin